MRCEMVSSERQKSLEGLVVPEPWTDLGSISEPAMVALFGSLVRLITCYARRSNEWWGSCAPGKEPAWTLTVRAPWILREAS